MNKRTLLLGTGAGLLSTASGVGRAAIAQCVPVDSVSAVAGSNGCASPALSPAIPKLVMDEPCSALNPIATAKIEELIDSLRGQCTQLIVTHSMNQARRVSDNTAFMYLGRIVENGQTSAAFTRPHVQRTQDYVTGRFG